MIQAKQVGLDEVEASNKYQDHELMQTPGHAALVFLGLDEVPIKKKNSLLSPQPSSVK